MTSTVRIPLPAARRVRRTFPIVALGVLPAALFIGVLATAAARRLPAYGLEFRGNLWRPGRLILHGHSPYEPRRLDTALSAVNHGKPLPGLAGVAQAVYPAPTHVLAAPLAALPFDLAMAIFVVLSVGALVGSLWLMGVRDWRCYGATFLSVAVVQGVKLGGITPFLCLSLALVWRYRDSRLGAALATAAAVTAKVFLWPVGLWLVASGRAGSFTRAVAVAVLFTLAGWAVIGFSGFIGYPHLLGTLAALEERRGDSLIAAGLGAGLSLTTSRIVAVSIGVVLLLTMVALARRRRDRASFVVALTAAFALTPIVWLQYFMLAFIPIAVYRVRFGAVWLVPLLLWLAPNDGELRPEMRPIVVHWIVLIAAVALPAISASAGVRRAAAPTVEPFGYADSGA
jgi:hypothetical protein